MDKFLKSGKYIFVSGFSIYVMLHFALAEKGAEMVPAFLPAPYFWNYFTGVCVLMFMISCFIGKLDKLASILMALYIFICILFIHIPKMADPMEFVNIFRGIILIGAMFMYATGFTKDDTFFKKS